MIASTQEVIAALGGVRKTAKLVDVSKSHVHRWSTSGVVVSLAHALRLADAYLPADASAAVRVEQLRRLAGLCIAPPA